MSKKKKNDKAYRVSRTNQNMVVAATVRRESSSKEDVAKVHASPRGIAHRGAAPAEA